MPRPRTPCTTVATGHRGGRAQRCPASSPGPAGWLIPPITRKAVPVSSTENTYTIVGNLTADPEVAFTTAGSPYARFTIAHTPRRFDRDTGQWVDGDPLFMRAVAWRQLAEHVGDSLHKGERVVATGQLRQSSWETENGEKRFAIDLHVDEIGPSLRFATAKVTKATRSHGQPEPVDPWVTSTTTGSTGADADPWAVPTAPQQSQPAVVGAGGSGDKPPF
ncbi:MAG: single-stranded DNA-binding protein [Streptosporangiales bacterium]|nr:single-stranded DNA-binding protein [Streptosporangiales bacterium]